jgi:Tol biopolymer transport system component
MRMAWTRPAAVALAVSAAVLGQAPPAVALGSAVTRVSVSTAGVQGNAQSARPDVSADGRYVAFDSMATTLVPGDTNGAADAFVHDTVTGVTTRVSVPAGGGQANGHSEDVSISADGRVVAFVSGADNIGTQPDVNGSWDIYAHDRDTDGDGVFDEPGATSTELVSVNVLGGQTAGWSLEPSVSGNGRFVAFSSFGLDPVTLGVLEEVYVRDLALGTTTKVSGPPGAAVLAAPSSGAPSISFDGRYVAYQTMSPAAPGDANATFDVVVTDRVTRLSTLVSAGPLGLAGNGWSGRPAISDDGRRVAFESQASDLVAGDTNGYWDVFVRDLAAGTTVRVSTSASGGPANENAFWPDISGDGAFVAFHSMADNLVAALDVNSPPGFAGDDDVFVYEVATGAMVRASEPAGGGEGDGHSELPALTGDGSRVAFCSRASNLVASDTNAAFDVFVRG